MKKSKVKKAVHKMHEKEDKMEKKMHHKEEKMMAKAKKGC